MVLKQPSAYTVVDAVQCARCYDIIYSRARHDFHSCTCDSVAIDGGFDYTKINYTPLTVASKDKRMQFHSIKLGVYATKQELFQDWSNGIDNHGRFYAGEAAKVGPGICTMNGTRFLVLSVQDEQEEYSMTWIDVIQTQLTTWILDIRRALGI